MGTIIGDGITFDDVLLVPQYSEVTPNMVDLTTHLTKKIKLSRRRRPRPASGRSAPRRRRQTGRRRDTV